MAAIRIILPYHLSNLAKVEREVTIEVAPPLTIQSLLDSLEASYPVLRGSIREHGTLRRRVKVRFYACEEDVSHDAADTPLPQAIQNGSEPFIILGAISGG